MNAVLFVNGQAEHNKIDILFKSVSLNFDFYVIDSFDLLMKKFEEVKVDVFICQLGLSGCNALELLQLARMYNPDVINMATGDNHCVDELVSTFNTENLFRFINMPWLYKDDIITPIHEAIESMHDKVQREYDIKALEEDAVVLKKKVYKLRKMDNFYANLFEDSRELLKIMTAQNYHFTSNMTKEEETDFTLFAYDTYIKYFYNDIEEFNPLLRELVDKYRNSTEGCFFSVKHNITETLKDDIKARIIFLIYILNEYIASHSKEYEINAVIGNTNNRYLIKYDYLFQNEKDKKFMDLVNSYNYKMLMFYIDGNCLKSDISVTEKGMECKIIVA